MKISYLKYLIVYLDNSFVDLPNKFTNKQQIVLDLVNTKDTILQTQHATTEIKEQRKQQPLKQFFWTLQPVSLLFDLYPCNCRSRQISAFLRFSHERACIRKTCFLWPLHRILPLCLHMSNKWLVAVRGSLFITWVTWAEFWPQEKWIKAIKIFNILLKISAPFEF